MEIEKLKALLEKKKMLVEKHKPKYEKLTLKQEKMRHKMQWYLISIDKLEKQIEKKEKGHIAQ